MPANYMQVFSFSAILYYGFGKGNAGKVAGTRSANQKIDQILVDIYTRRGVVLLPRGMLGWRTGCFDSLHSNYITYFETDAELIWL